MKDEFIEASQDVDVLSKLCPEDLVSVKPEDVSFLYSILVRIFCQLNFICCPKECRDLLLSIDLFVPGNFFSKNMF